MGLFDRIDSIDSLRLAQALSRHLNGAADLPVLIEVNIGGEPAKSGIHPGHLQAFIDDFTKYEGLRLTGLMAIPPFFEDPEHVRPFFRKLRELSERFNLPELSMGMSHDFEVAVEEGATMVRIGTSLFGERH